MSYTNLELSTESGEPVELFEFRQGTNFWRYTTAPVEVIKTNQVYTPEYIKRDAVKQTDDTSKGGIKLTFPRTNKLAKSFLSVAPEGVTTLTIWRGHFSDSVEDYVAYWKGRVLKVSAGGSEISIECESVFTSLKRPGLRARYERSCRHGLYSKMCGVSMSSFKVTDTVISIDATEMEFNISDAGLQPDGTFTGGIITNMDGERRLITSHSSTTIRISRPFPISLAGKQVDLYPGCDKLKSTCISKFNNLNNFGGFPFIPYINPFSGRSVV